MWVYKKTEPQLWTVGHYRPDGGWEPESDHESTDAAAARVHYLRGGRGERLTERVSALEEWREEHAGREDAHAALI